MKNIFKLRLGLILMALAMILIGIFLLGEARKVQSNASYLCLDCLGIG